MRFRAVLALAAAVFGGLFLAPAGADAAGYPPTTCAMLSVSTTHPLPGEEITVSGTNFLPNANVRLELHSPSYVLKTVTTNGSGSFTTQVKLPNGVFGTHQLVAATGAPSTCPTPTITLHIQKHGAAGSSAERGGSGGGTAFTGVDVLLIVLVAALLIGAGVALTRGGKRKRTGHPLID
jgi:hexosaminidase